MTASEAREIQNKFSIKLDDLYKRIKCHCQSNSSDSYIEWNRTLNDLEIKELESNGFEIDYNKFTYIYKISW